MIKMCNEGDEAYFKVTAFSLHLPVGIEEDQGSFS
jgi:hypothetical protein